MPRGTINYVLAATLWSTGATLADIAPQVGAKSAETLRNGLLRKGITKNGLMALPLADERIQNATLRVINEAGAGVRQRFDKLLNKHVGKLEEVPARASIKHITKVGMAMEPLARTAKIVYGWGDGNGDGLVKIGRMTQADDSAIDVQATPVQLPEENK